MKSFFFLGVFFFSYGLIIASELEEKNLDLCGMKKKEHFIEKESDHLKGL